MNVPTCTIEAAIALFTSLKGSSLKETEGGTETTYSVQARPLDLLAICVRATAQPNSGEVWIVDSSLAPQQQVVVSWFGKRGVTAIQEREIRVGSVVRFHSVVLRRKLSRGDTTTFEFWHSWENQAGLGWSVLDHVICGSNPKRPIPTKMYTCPTSQIQIQSLVAWYRQSNVQHQEYQEHLSPVPCQQRSLEKVQSSLGVISNVMVHVTNISLLAPTNDSKKRWRSSNRHSVVVTVSDGRHTVMPLVLVQGHGFQKTLDLALQQGQPVMLYHVACRKASEAFGQQATTQNAVVLMPTAMTTMVLLPQETSMLRVAHSDDMPNEQTPAFFTATQPSQAQHSTLAMTASPEAPSQTLRRPSSVPVVTLEAPLVAMEFVHTSWGREPPHSAVPPPDELLSVLTHFKNGRLDYHDAILHIPCQHDMTRCPSTNKKETQMRVHANATSLRHLCGGIEITELKQCPLLLLHVREWLQGILEEPIPLRWRLVPSPDVHDWKYELDMVTLVKL